MENAEERILQYPDLSSGEQRAVEEHAAAHPDLAALLQEVKALERLLSAARAFEVSSSGELDPEGLAHVLATPRSQPGPSAFEAAFDRVEAAGPEAAARREQRVVLAQRLQALDASSDAERPDAAAHFEALTGHRLDAEPVPGEAEASPSAPAPDREARAGAAAADPLGSRFAPLRRSWARYVVAAVLAVFVLYGALFAASRLSQSKMDRLALVTDGRLSVEGYGPQEMRLRGGAATSDRASLDQRYLEGLRRLRAAHTSTLGLFPRYDAEALRRAARDLDAVAEEAEPGSFVQLEALFFLGKARLAQGDRAGATQALRRVVAGGGRLGPEAQRILTQLYEGAAYDGSPGDGRSG